MEIFREQLSSVVDQDSVSIDSTDKDEQSPDHDEDTQDYPTVHIENIETSFDLIQQVRSNEPTIVSKACSRI